MRSAGAIVILMLSLGVAVYAVGAYSLFPLGAAVHPDMRATFAAHRPGLIPVHVFASVFALALGPFQFWTRLRTSRPSLHRWTGRLYLGIGVLFGGLAAMLAGFRAFGGPVARAGFVLLAAMWLFTGLQAYQAVRARDFTAHRRWMVRNFALTFAAVTLRLWLPAMVVAGIPFGVAYLIVAWLCWVPNLIVAEIAFNGSLVPSQSSPI